MAKTSQKRKKQMQLARERREQYLRDKAKGEAETDCYCDASTPHYVCCVCFNRVVEELNREKYPGSDGVVWETLLGEFDVREV